MNIVPQQFVVAADDGVFTDSRTVAKDFDKPHKNVIRAQAMQAFDTFNKAYQQHLSDKRHVSESARDMRRWQDVKPQQLQALAMLHPQMRLALN